MPQPRREHTVKGPKVGTAGSLRPGLVLADDQYETQATRLLQSRLRILYGVMAGAALAFYGIEQVLPPIEGTWTPGNVTKPGALVHLGFVLLTVLIVIRLSVRPASRPLLHVLDATALYLGAGAALTVYAFSFKEGPRDVLALIAIFVIARAVVVPSSPWATFLLSLPIPIALLSIDLSHDSVWSYDEREITNPELVASARVWNQVVILFGIGVATVTSRLGSALRARLDAAHRIGQYHLDEKIGEGAMGEVYLATHAMLRRPTAVKLLRPELLGEETIARFDQEVRLASRLTHTNTIRIFDYGRTPDGLFYYAMEHVRGQDLARIVETDGPLSPSHVIHVLEQVCRSLSEAHDLGLVHRDIKPSNIMLCTKGGEYDVVKLLDFGLATDLRDANTILEHDGAVCGTPETIAPEVLHGEKASPACDLYALGAVGVYLLTAQPIFNASTPLEFLRAHIEEEPISPSKRGVSVPPDLEGILMRCLHKDPATRPSTATDMGEALRTCADAASWTRSVATSWWMQRQASREPRLQAHDSEAHEHHEHDQPQHEHGGPDHGAVGVDRTRAGPPQP